jgi:hypothetical protein
MNLRPVGVLAALGALVFPLLLTSTASAQMMEPDGARFRGGVSLQGGVLAVPGVVSLGSVGIEGQLGGQISNNWAVYAIPNFGGLFGKQGGISIGAGALAEYTFNGLPLSVAAGPEVGLFAAFGESGCGNQAGCTSASDSAGAFYGARLHVAYYPIIVRNGLRRRALSIGVDARLMTGAFGAASANNTGNVTATASVNSFALWPMASIGYTAF